MKYKTHILEDNKTLYEYKIKKDDKLEIIFKNEGGTMAKGLVIFIWVFIFLFYFFFLFMGFIPFFAFIIPNILIKGLSTIVNYLYELTDPNNFMNSVLYFVKTYVIPFIRFIFEYFGLFIFTYLITFFSLYHIYYYAKKENVCDAYKTTHVVSLLTSFLIIIFYFVSNTATFLRFVASFVPVVIRQPFINGANIVANLRLTFIGMIPYIGQSQVNMVEIFAKMFKGVGYLKLYGSQLLDNWDVAMELLKTDDARKAIQEAGVDEIINYIRVIEKAESHYANGKEITNQNRKNAEKMEQIIPCVSPSGTAYVLRSIFHNLIKMIIDMTFFIDICKTDGSYEIAKEKMREDFMKLLELQKNKNITEDQIQKKMEDYVQQIKNIKLDSVINIDCLINTIVNGVTFSSLITFLFLIVFILFFFVKL